MFKSIFLFLFLLTVNAFGNQLLNIEKNYVSSLIVDSVYDVDNHYWIKPRNEECIYEIKRPQRGWFDWLWGSKTDALPLFDVNQNTLNERHFELHRFDPMVLPVDFFETYNIPGLNTCDYYLVDERTQTIAFCKKIPLNAVLRIFTAYSKNQYDRGYSIGYSLGYSSGYSAGQSQTKSKAEEETSSFHFRHPGPVETCDDPR